MYTRHKVARYSLNEAFFYTIDTEEKAYWLGFLYADGCVVETGKEKRPKVLQVKLAEKDASHLEKLKTALQYEGPIRHRTRAPRKMPNGIIIPIVYDAALGISSRHLAKDLVKQGCIPRKSLTLQFPTSDQVPRHLLHHFIRGYFDGDGCISSTARKVSGRQRYQASMLGTKAFLTGVQEFIEKQKDCPSTHIYPNRNIWVLVVSGSQNVKKFFSLIYRDMTVSLERKRDRFLACVNTPNPQPGLPPCFLLSPEGERVRVENYRQFGKSTGLDPSGFWRLIIGQIGYNKGYTFIEMDKDENGIPYKRPQNRRKVAQLGHSDIPQYNPFKGGASRLNCRNQAKPRLD